RIRSAGSGTSPADAATPRNPGAKASPLERVQLPPGASEVRPAFQQGGFPRKCVRGSGQNRNDRIPSRSAPGRALRLRDGPEPRVPTEIATSAQESANYHASNIQDRDGRHRFENS